MKKKVTVAVLGAVLVFAMLVPRQSFGFGLFGGGARPIPCGWLSQIDPVSATPRI